MNPVSRALQLLTFATLGLCAVAVSALCLTKPRQQAVIKAVFWVLIGTVFGVMLMLSAMDHLLGG
jgi:hypothetical protein